MPFDDEDFEGFDDPFKGQKWFKDPPPSKPEPSAPNTTGPGYEPLPDVINQNQMFQGALEYAPSILYERFKQYGQLGVLGWCSEFSDLIDDLKQLGFQGNMFVNTRAQALQTCQELLRLKLEIKMQIIIMHLSSQVARLRRFLDGDTEYDDYPIPNFPLDPRQMS